MTFHNETYDEFRIRKKKGTHDIHLLITGPNITGLNAFS